MNVEVIGQAKVWAHEAHSNQKRKGKDVPYVVHLVRVTELLHEVGADPEVIVAGWLHDIVEDQGVSLWEIRIRFGGRVAQIVGDVTEHDKDLPWEVRKKQAEEHIPHMPHDSLLVKSADIIANMEDTIVDYGSVGEVLFEVFNGSKEAQLAHKKNLVTAITAAWPENPLLERLTRVYARFEKSVMRPDAA